MSTPEKKHRRHLVSRVEFSRRAGRAPSSITEACEVALKKATVGKRIDCAHPVAVAWAIERGIAPAQLLIPRAMRKTSHATKPDAKSKTKHSASRRTTGPGQSPAEEVRVEAVASVNVEDFLNWTLGDVTRSFGTLPEFRDHLAARKTIEDIRTAGLKNAGTEGRLIGRELVRTHVFGAIESANRQLLTDSPKTIARRVYALAKGGAPVEEAEITVREIISSQLKPVKSKAARVLRAKRVARPKKTPDNKEA